MPHESLQIGSVTVHALLDSDAELSTPMVEAFPDIDPEALLAWRSRDPGLFGHGDTWRLRVRAWLVRHAGGLLLMDTGVGATVSMAWFPDPGRLSEALAELDVAPHHIDTLVISHIHDDHIGGLTTTGSEPAFPNARHLLQAADLEAARADAAEDEEGAEIWDVLLRPVHDAGLLETVEGDERLGPELELHHAPGHTPGHQVLRITSQGNRALLAADTWNHPGQFAHPDWPSGPDRDHAGAASTRRALLAELFSHPGTTVAPTHLTEAFGQVVNGKDGLAAWRGLV
jgi:glyoxylase-like metal-dependent hydrolase (beta-lactamase superfamily II)